MRVLQKQVSRAVFFPDSTQHKVQNGARLKFSHLCTVPRTFPYLGIRKIILEQNLLIPTPNLRWGMQQ